MIDDDEAAIVQRMAVEMATKGALEFHFTATSALRAVALLQLALRHRGIDDGHRVFARTFIEHARSYFWNCPAVLEVIRRGDDPSEDRTSITPDLRERIRADVLAGRATHDCGEWWGVSGRCLLCDRIRDHQHEWVLRARIERAEIDEDDPVAHTAFVLLQCPCGAVTPFPLQNYALTTARYKATLRRDLAADGFFFDPV